MGTEHLYVSFFRNNHGECLTCMKLCDQAEKELLESELLQQTMLGVKHARTRKAFERLATLYDAEGKVDDAAKWRSRIAAESGSP